MKPNERSLFWLEPATVSALLEKVDAEASGAPARPGTARPISEGGGIEEVSANKKTGAAAAADLPDGAVSFPTPGVPEGPLETRLESLLAWLAEATGCERGFVADKEGLALADRAARPELVAAAAAVAGRWEEVGRTLGLPEKPGLTIDLEDDGRLHLLAAESRWGRLNLGFTTRHPLTKEALAHVANAFQTTVDEQGAEET